LNKKVFNSSLVLLHPKSIYSIEMGAMLLKQCICHIALHSIVHNLVYSLLIIIDITCTFAVILIYVINVFVWWGTSKLLKLVHNPEYIFYRDGSNVIKTVYMSYCLTLNCWPINKYFDITGLLPLMLCTAEMTYEHARLCIAINFKIEYCLLPKLAKGIRK
jgi:hypothetical protein